MANKLSQENQLYFYRLFVNEFGCGRQVFLPKVAEACAADGIDPINMDFSDIRELLSALDFVTLTDFKGGRTYATIAAKPEWDEILTTLSSDGTEKKPSKGGKPWKRKKTTLRPIRPKQQYAPTQEAQTPPVQTPPVQVSQAQIQPLHAQTQQAQTQPPKAKAAHDQEVEPEPASKEIPSQPFDATRPKTMQPQAPSRPHTPSPLPRSLPVDFWTDVRCTDEFLMTLTALLPFDTDVHTVLEEDWQIARATGTLNATQGAVSFALRYLYGDGSPVTVNLERQVHAPGSKRWLALSLDASEEHLTADAHTPLHRADEGAWADLSAVRLPPHQRRRLLWEFARVMAFTSWDDLCAQLREHIAPERWAPAGVDGVPLLREYLMVTLARIVEQNKLIATVDGTRALWHTGLYSASGAAVYCLLDAAEQGSTWKFSGFASEGDQRLTEFDRLPRAASYLTTLNDLILFPEETLRIAPHTDLSQEAAQVAFRRAQAHWRSVVPVWDPQDGQIKVLIPFWQSNETPWRGNETPATSALIIHRDSDGLVASGTLSLGRAYSCARIVSSEQPAWLSGALGQDEVS